jgi:DNA-3-methyladenine glycosylase II
MSIELGVSLRLPDRYRPAVILAFHGRDKTSEAEEVRDDRLAKGLMWNGRPAHLEIVFEAGDAYADLEVDGDPGAGDETAFRAMVTRMLGLTQTIEAFEASHAVHPDAGRLIARHSGLRLPVAATPFEALVWAVTGQQISVAVAVSLRRKLIALAGVRNSRGFLCHPDAVAVSRLREEDLRSAGFSATKTRTVLAISRMMTDGTLPLDDWLEALPAEAAAEILLAVPGIGPWTVSYTLLRGYGWLDGSLHGDVAVRSGLQSLLGRQDKLSETETREWLAPFSPWRALVAAHLWAWRSAVAY